MEPIVAVGLVVSGAGFVAIGGGVLALFFYAGQLRAENKALRERLSTLVTPSAGRPLNDWEELRNLKSKLRVIEENARDTLKVLGRE